MRKNIILIDTSVWIKYFKQGQSVEALHLDHLLADERVAVCDPIKVEILSGVSSTDDFRKLSTWLEGLKQLNPSVKIWKRIAESRFQSARKGIQLSIIDLWIAWAAHEEGVMLWSLDKDFRHIADTVNFKEYHP